MDITQIRQEVANHIEEDNSSDSWSIGDSILYWEPSGKRFDDPKLPDYLYVGDISEWLTQFTDKEILDFHGDNC